MYPLLDEPALRTGLNFLRQADADLAALVDQYGPPPLWARPPGFPTLIRIILEQQVSLASARATFERLIVHTEWLTPERFLALDDATLRAIGFSRQKTHYGRALAQAIADEQVSLEALGKLDDAAVRTVLLTLKGIGPWTADIYLLMALRRPDIWPAGDLALQLAVQRVKQLPAKPTQVEMQTIAEPWRPWRAVAARVLWQHYLSQPRPGNNDNAT